MAATAQAEAAVAPHHPELLTEITVRRYYDGKGLWSFGSLKDGAPETCEEH